MPSQPPSPSASASPLVRRTVAGDSPTDDARSLQVGSANRRRANPLVVSTAGDQSRLANARRPGRVGGGRIDFRRTRVARPARPASPARRAATISPTLANPSKSPTPRILRFDFHPTLGGWRLSEVNSDVPGGYTEASSFTRLMAEHYPEARSAGDVGASWADAIAAAAADGEARNRRPATCRGIPRRHASGRLSRRSACRARPAADAGASAANPLPRWPGVFANRAIGIAARGHPAILPGRTACPAGGRAANGARFFGPAAPRSSMRRPRFSPRPSDFRWYGMTCDLNCRPGGPVCRTRAARAMCRGTPIRWLLKTAYCNTGDTVCIRELLSTISVAADQRDGPALPGPLDRPAAVRGDCRSTRRPGRFFPCLGVYTINGIAAGIYGRYSHRPLIDYAAVDVAVLIEEGEES